MNCVNSVPADKGIPATLNCPAFGNADISVVALDTVKRSISEIMSGLTLYSSPEECSLELLSSVSDKVISDELRKNANVEESKLCSQKPLEGWLDSEVARDLRCNVKWITAYSEMCSKEHINALNWVDRTQENLICVQRQLIERLAQEKAALEKLHKLLADFNECKVNKQ